MWSEVCYNLSRYVCVCSTPSLSLSGPVSDAVVYLSCSQPQRQLQRIKLVLIVHCQCEWLNWGMDAFTRDGPLDYCSAFTELMQSSESKVVPAFRHPTGMTDVQMKYPPILNLVTRHSVVVGLTMWTGMCSSVGFDSLPERSSEQTS
jgi:hypothetical protein